VVHALADALTPLIAATELLPLAAFVTDADGAMVHVNAWYVALSGASAAEARGAGWLDAVHPEDRAQVAARWRVAFETGEHFRSLHRLRHPDGALRFVLMRALRSPDAKARGAWVGTADEYAARQSELSGAGARDALFRRVLESTHAGIWEWDVATGALAGNDQVQRMLAWTDEVTPSSIEQFAQMLHPDEATDILGRMTAFVESGGSTWDVEQRIRTGKGDFRWVHVTAYAVRDDSGRTQRLVGAVQDIHERKLQALALEQSLTDLDEAQQIARLGSWYYDVVTQKGRWSAETYRLFGIDPAVEPPRFEDRREQLHPDDYQGVMAGIARGMGGEPWESLYRIVVPGGGYRWIRGTGRPVRGADGSIVALRGTVQDVTERMEAEEEQHRMAMIAQRTSHAVMILDREARIEWVNPGFTALSGYTLDEARGRLPGAFLQGPATDQQTVAEMQRAAAAGSTYQGEIVNYTKDGRPYWVDVEAQPLLDRAGKLRGFMVIELDITERKETEQVLIAAREEAIEASRVKSRFLANMSHEIRTPMNGLLGMTAVLLESSLTPEQREQLELVESSGRHLLSILNDILDISKIEAGRTELEEIPFSPAAEMEEIRRLFLVRAQEKGLEFKLSVAPDVPPAVLGDPGRVRQLITNLVGNAIKFTEKGRVMIGLGSSRGVLQIVVEDTGIGIPASRLSSVFDAFAQVDSSTTRRFGGTGLGLTICRDLVNLMNGRIWAESIEGKGSTFRVALPLPSVSPQGVRLPDPRRSAIMPAFAAEDVAGKRVLVGEDNPVNARLVELLLTKRRIVSSFAEDGAATLALATAEEFDLILMDVQMPEMDGLEATRRLRAQGSKVPIIALTANAMAGDAERCLAAGCTAYLSKPLAIDAFNAMLDKYLSVRARA
jgi:PAS domain S-box-containing protein